jgi:hypothetical protein
MNFEPYGPFPLRPYVESEDGRWKSKFWAMVNASEDCLSTANGIYIFSLKFGSKFTPWYVGKTCSEKGFSGEVFQGHKLDHYFEVADGRRGLPFIHLIAHVEENRRNFCPFTCKGDREIELVETYLIGMALGANPELRNNKKTKFYRTLDIEGVIGPKYDGRPREAARTLKNVLGLVKA